MQEILVVVAIALAIFFLPRLMGRKSSSEKDQQPMPQRRFQPQPGNRVSKIILPGWVRLSILSTVLWISACTAFFKPWEDNMFKFVLISMAPVIVYWGCVWVWFGYKKYRR